MVGLATRKILDAVFEEREAQDARYGRQDHAEPYWLSILGEEYGEICREVYEAGAKGGPINPNYRTELVQLAAVAVQMIEAYDRRRG